MTGLDPALSLYKYEEVTHRLDKTDATYVEVIITNAGFLGQNLPIGHATFYPNGGKEQPGCKNDFTGLCSHGRALLFYIESISVKEENCFVAVQCQSFEELVKGKCSAINELRMMGGEPGNQK